MRNYELVRAIYEELTAGNGKGSFSNPYLNTVISVTKLIERERPEMKDATAIQPGWDHPCGGSVDVAEIEKHRGLQIGPDGTVTELEETRFE